MPNANYEVAVDWFGKIEEGKGLINSSVTKALVASGNYAAEDVLSETESATGTKFAIVVRAVDGDANNYVCWRADTSSPSYTGGTAGYSFDSGATWTADATYDFQFEVYDGTTLQQNYNVNDDGESIAYGALWRCQTFTITAGHTLTSVNLYLWRFGSPGTVTVSIKATDGSGLPTGADLCSGTTNGNSLLANGVYGPFEWRQITFDTSTELSTAGVWTFPNIVKAKGCSGEITKAQAICETTGLTPRLTLFLFNATPTCQLNDNAANTALLHADLANYVGKIDFPAMEDLGGDSEALVSPSTVGNLPLAFNCASTDDNLYGVLVTRDAITGEVATMDMTINLTIEQTYEGEDATSDVKNIHFGRGKSDELGKAEVGQLSLTVNNDTGLYSPSNSSGTYYGYLLPKRRVQVKATYAYFDYHLWYGYIEEIIPHPHLTEQDCVITAVDGLDYLARHDLATALYKSVKTGTLHSYILDDAKWLKLARLDDGQDTVPYWYGQDIKSRFAQTEIDDSEQGFSYIDAAGSFVFEDRHHRSSAEHQTSQATFNNTMANASYSLNARNVYNIIKIAVPDWTVQSISTLWTLGEVPSIPAGETLTWWGEAAISGTPVFVDAWTTPVATTDYTANSQSDGGGDDETANISIATTKFARTIKLAVTNNASHLVYITLLQARGTYYSNEIKSTRKAEDSTSQGKYQKRTFTLDGKYMPSVDTAQDYCNYAIGKFKDPRGQLSITIINEDATRLAQILAREISDRITVVNTKLGINDDFFIDYMEHDISISGKLHTVTYRLSDTINEDFWALDFSALASSTTEGQTKLGY